MYIHFPWSLAEPAVAARLFGKAEALIGQDDWQLPAFDQQRLATALDELRAHLDPAAYAAHRGGALADLASIVAQAGSVAACLASTDPPVG